MMFRYPPIVVEELSMRNMYLSRLQRICGVDENGANRLVTETPYCLADFAYADPRFVWDWCKRLNIPTNMPPKRIVDAEELMRIEEILREARKNNRSYRMRKQK